MWLRELGRSPVISPFTSELSSPCPVWTPFGPFHLLSTLQRVSLSALSPSCHYCTFPLRSVLLRSDLRSWHTQAATLSSTPAFGCYQPLVSFFSAMNWLVSLGCSSSCLPNREVTFSLYSQSVLIFPCKVHMLLSVSAESNKLLWTSNWSLNVFISQ